MSVEAAIAFRRFSGHLIWRLLRLILTFGWTQERIDLLKSWDLFEARYRRSYESRCAVRPLAIVRPRDSMVRRTAQTLLGLSVISVLLPGMLSSCSYCGVSEGPQVNFDNPIPGGSPVADIAAAKARVTFHPLVPPDLGRNIGPIRKI